MKGKGEAGWAKVVDGPDRTRRRAGLRGKKGGGLWPRESERFFLFSTQGFRRRDYLQAHTQDKNQITHASMLHGVLVIVNLV